jgi:hypothetical protein
MLIVLPVLAHDTHFLSRLLSTWEAFGNMETHRLLLVHGDEESALAARTKESMELLFAGVGMHLVHYPRFNPALSEERRQVIRRNALWTSFVHNSDPKLPESCFLWHDAPALPLDVEAYNKLEAYYTKQKLPVIGHRVSLPGRPGESYVHRVAVYPMNFKERNRLYFTAASGSKSTFAIHHRFGVDKMGADECPLIYASHGIKGCRKSTMEGIAFEGDNMDKETEYVPETAVLFFGAVDDTVLQFLPEPASKAREEKAISAPVIDDGKEKAAAEKAAAEKAAAEKAAAEKAAAEKAAAEKAAAEKAIAEKKVADEETAKTEKPAPATPQPPAIASRPTFSRPPQGGTSESK